MNRIAEYTVTAENSFMAIEPLDDRDFNRIRKYIYEKTGISLSPLKKMMVASRLQKRLVANGMNRFGDYFYFATSAGAKEENQHFIDLLTTNETYFFREPMHFSFLQQHILPKFRNEPLRIWSAASSSGEEVYSLAMEVADFPGISDWQILGSDLSTKVIRQAQLGHYPMERNSGITPERLRKFCLKGVRAQEGTFLIDQKLMDRVAFQQINLIEPIPRIGMFDVIFLRNVLIYFDMETKYHVVNNVMRQLNPGGYFFISHTENLRGIQVPNLRMLKPSIFHRPG